MPAQPDWQRSVTPVPPPPEVAPRLPQLLYAGVVTGAWAGVLCLLLYALARMVGVEFLVALPGRTDLQQVPWFVVLLLPLLVGVVGGLLSALVLGQRHARAIVYWVGTATAVITLAAPLRQPDAVGWSTRIWLAVLHLVAWFLIVPQLARIAGDSEPTAAAPSTG